MNSYKFLSYLICLIFLSCQNTDEYGWTVSHPANRHQENIFYPAYKEGVDNEGKLDISYKSSYDFNIEIWKMNCVTNDSLSRFILEEKPHKVFSLKNGESRVTSLAFGQWIDYGFMYRFDIKKPENESIKMNQFDLKLEFYFE